MNFKDIYKQISYRKSQNRRFSLINKFAIPPYKAKQMQTFPFLSMVQNTKTGTSCFALINIISKEAISYYELTGLDIDEYDEFMELAQNWWNKCPIIPISVYYYTEFKAFEHAKRLLYQGDYKITAGFSGASLSNLCEKRIKRKIITIN